MVHERRLLDEDINALLEVGHLLGVSILLLDLLGGLLHLFELLFVKRHFDAGLHNFHFAVCGRGVLRLAGVTSVNLLGFCLIGLEVLHASYFHLARGSRSYQV